MGDSDKEAAKVVRIADLDQYSVSDCAPVSDFSMRYHSSCEQGSFLSAGEVSRISHQGGEGFEFLETLG